MTDPLVASVQEGLKRVMRSFPQGVTVVTAKGPSGPLGITVSSFTSVSLEPPLVLVSIAKSSALHDHFRASPSFAVNFLADDQKTVSDRFAGRLELKDRFRGLKFTEGRTGSPFIEGARAVIDCKAWKTYDGGDHSLLVGEVAEARVLNGKRPLVYYGQQYTTTEAAEFPAPPSDMVW